jgi:hypothetical protein
MTSLSAIRRIGRPGWLMSMSGLCGNFRFGGEGYFVLGRRSRRLRPTGVRSGLPLRALCQDGEQVRHRRVPVFLNQAGDGEAPATPAGPANHDHVGRAHVGNWQPLGTKSFVPASGLWGRFMTQPCPGPPWISVPISASRFGRVHFSSQAPTAWQHIRVRPSDSCREDPISSGTGLGSSLNWSDDASRFSISSHHRGKLESWTAGARASVLGAASTAPSFERAP